MPADDLTATADELAGRLATGPSKAIQMTKWLLNRSFESSRQTAFEEESYAQELVTSTADFKERASPPSPSGGPPLHGLVEVVVRRSAGRVTAAVQRSK